MVAEVWRLRTSTSGLLALVFLAGLTSFGLIEYEVVFLWISKDRELPLNHIGYQARCVLQRSRHDLAFDSFNIISKLGFLLNGMPASSNNADCLTVFPWVRAVS